MYEITYIVTPEKSEQEAIESQRKIEEIIQNHNGVIGKTYFLDETETDTGELGLQKLPAKRRLAFPIEKQNYGYYIVTVFEMPGDKAEQLNKKLDAEMPEILRFLIIKPPKKTLARKVHSPQKAAAPSTANTILREGKPKEPPTSKKPQIEEGEGRALPETKALVEEAKENKQEKDKEAPTPRPEERKESEESDTKKKEGFDPKDLDKKLDEILEEEF